MKLRNLVSFNSTDSIIWLISCYRTFYKVLNINFSLFGTFNEIFEVTYEKHHRQTGKFPVTSDIFLFE